jgi:hypothetical protein
MGIANEVITRFILMWACCGMIWSGGVMMWWVSYTHQVLSFLSRGKSYPSAFLYGPWCLSGPTIFYVYCFKSLKMIRDPYLESLVSIYMLQCLPLMWACCGLTHAPFLYKIFYI